MKKFIAIIIGLTLCISAYPGKLYWVGDASTWGTASNWSSSSGGAGGVVLPGATDTVYFDANSFTGNTKTVSVNVGAVVHTLDFSGVVHTAIVISPSSAGNGITIYGSWIGKTGVSYGTSGYFNLYATTSQTITTGGSNFPSVVVNGVGGSWTLQDDYYGQNFALYNGTWDCNNFNMSVASFAVYTGTKEIILGNSTTLTLQAYNVYGSANYSFTYNQSTVRFASRSSGTNASLGSNLTCYNCQFFSPNSTNTNWQEFALNANLTVLNHFEGRGWNATDKRGRIRSSGSAMQNITTKTGSFENIDFCGIKAYGDYGWDLSATNCGNQRNENITFRPGVNLYWYPGTGNYADSTKWFTASGGSGTSSTIIPLAQDTAIVDQNSFSSAGTLTFNLLYGPGKFDMTTEDNSASLTMGSIMTFWGSFLLSSSNTITGSPTLRQHPLYNCYLYLGSNNLANYFTSYVGSPYSVTMLSNLNVSALATGYMGITSGLDMNGYNITTYYLNLSTSLPTGSRDLFFSSGTHTFLGNSSYSSALSLGATTSYVDYGTATFDINCNLATGTALSNTLSNVDTIYNLLIRGSTVRYFTLVASGTMYIKNLEVRDGKTVRFSSSTKYRFDNVITSAPAESYVVFEASSTANYQFENMTSSDIILDQVNISRCTASGFARIRSVVGANYSSIAKFIGVQYSTSLKTAVGLSKITQWRAINSVDGGNNTGIIFNQQI